MQIEVYLRGARIFKADLPADVMLGRQGREDPQPCALVPDTDPEAEAPERLIFAPKTMLFLSRKQIRLQRRGENEVLVTNYGKKNNSELRVRLQPALRPGEQRLLKMPFTLNFGQYEFACGLAAEVDTDPDDFETIPASPNVLTGGVPAIEQSLSEFTSTTGRQFDERAYEDLLVRLQAAVQTVQLSLTSGRYLQHVVEAACRIAELERAAILMRNEDTWKMTASASLVPETAPWEPSSTVLERVLTTQRTLYRKPPTTADFAQSLQGVESVAASPIRNRQEQIIGVLYGERRSSGRQLGRLEARMIELLASGVSAALARVEEEAKAVKAQVCLQQFVTPEIARFVQDDPTLLQGRQEDVSLLFCDISGFSKIAHALGPATTIAWLNDVLQELSQCVLEQEGTLVDYGGDEIFAMFGAPVPRPDHAQRAYAAGLAMKEALPRLNERWKPRVGAETSIGIGINSGRVLVGNVGCNLKLKYGAHGTHVNLASRVQSATRFFKVNFMATEATASLLEECPNRRLGAVRVKGIDSPVQLFELGSDLSSDWKDVCDKYEDALKAWEAGNVEQAMRRLSHLTSLHPQDGPTLALLNRVLSAWNAGRPAEAVWELPSK